MESIGNHKKKMVNEIEQPEKRRKKKQAEMVKVLRHEKKKKKETDGECNRTEVKRKKITYEARI